MRVLVTGAAGFIGSNVGDRLIEQGHSVFGFDNCLTGRESNLDPALWGSYLLRADITNRTFFYDYANQIEPDLVIHCAASYKDPDKWHLDVDTNIAGAINVAAVAKHHGARVIYFQTVLPPISSYAISKIAAEHYLRLSGVPLTVFRLAAVYGPRNISGAIPTFYRQISNGEPCTVVEDATRDFVFIEDLMREVGREVELIDRKKGWTYDVRTGIETPIKHIPHMIGEMLDVKPTVSLVSRNGDDVAAYEMDGIPLYKPTPFVDGLAKAVDWYERNGVTETHTHLRINA